MRRGGKIAERPRALYSHYQYQRDRHFRGGEKLAITIDRVVVNQLVERVANTPIPRSYSIHLKQTVTLYLFALPFTLVKELGWAMIPLVTVVAFTLMGIEGIADEIEMPFGLDKFDLPLGECVLRYNERIV